MKKGISLIVLVITIVIIIILAGAVILNLADKNPIDSARIAAVMSEQSDINTGVTLYLSSVGTSERDGWHFVVKEGATAIDANALDAAGDVIGAGYYELADVTVLCGETLTSENPFPGSVTNLLSKLGITSSKYAAKTANWKTVMNASGNVKLVQVKDGNVVVATAE